MTTWGQRYVTYRLGDWLFIAFLAASYVGVFFIQPRHRIIISLTDPALSYPLLEQTVGAALLFFCAVGIPLLIFGLFYYIRRNLSHTRTEFQNVFLAFFLCILMTLITSDAIKKMTGRPRPNFFQLAQYDPVKGAQASAFDSREAYQSFPSGHVTLSFAGLLFLSQFLFQHLSPLSPLHTATALHVDKVAVQQLSRVNNLPSLVLPFLPLVLATWISLTRITDYWHFCEDVVGGVLVGSFYAYTTFTYCYLERRWTWLALHPEPGLHSLLQSDASSSSVSSDDGSFEPRLALNEQTTSVNRGGNIAASEMV